MYLNEVLMILFSSYLNYMFSEGRVIILKVTKDYNIVMVIIIITIKPRRHPVLILSYAKLIFSFPVVCNLLLTLCPKLDQLLTDFCMDNVD